MPYRYRPPYSNVIFKMNVDFPKGFNHYLHNWEIWKLVMHTRMISRNLVKSCTPHNYWWKLVGFTKLSNLRCFSQISNNTKRNYNFESIDITVFKWNRFSNTSKLWFFRRYFQFDSKVCFFQKFDITKCFRLLQITLLFYQIEH